MNPLALQDKTVLGESPPILMSGLVKFDSLIRLKLYLRELLTRYERESDRYGQKIASLMRLLEKREQSSKTRRMNVQRWEKVGMVMVSSRDSLFGMLEIMLEAME